MMHDSDMILINELYYLSDEKLKQLEDALLYGIINKNPKDVIINE